MLKIIFQFALPTSGVTTVTRTAPLHVPPVISMGIVHPVQLVTMVVSVDYNAQQTAMVVDV